MTALGRLEGRVGIVTGGARGIGLAVCERLVDAGAAVAIWDRDAPTAHQAAESLRDRGGDVQAHNVDVTVPTPSPTASTG